MITITARPVKRQTHAEAIAQQKRDAQVLRALPGVAAATWISQMPMSTSGSNSGFALDRKQARQSLIMSTYFAPPGAIDVLGLKIVEGRDFTDDDMVEFDSEKDSPTKVWPRSIILTKAAAEQLFPGTSAVGKTIYFGTGDDAAEMRVVGVVERLQTVLAETGPKAEYSAILPLRDRSHLSEARDSRRARPARQGDEGRRGRAARSREPARHPVAQQRDRPRQPLPQRARARVDADRA